jgi:hypothetical protein
LLQLLDSVVLGSQDMSVKVRDPGIIKKSAWNVVQQYYQNNYWLAVNADLWNFEHIQIPREFYFRERFCMGV